MRLLEIWVATPAAEAVGWTLLHSLWQEALIAALLWTALASLRSPRARYLAACLALLAMLVSFGWTLAGELPDSGPGSLKATKPVFPAWKPAAIGNNAVVSAPAIAAVVPWLALFWIGGVAIFYFGQIGAWISVVRLRRRGVCCAAERWQCQAAHWGARLRIARQVVVLESCLAEVPMVLGHLRPVILMPVGLLAGLPPDQVESILLHELAHIRRYDYLVNLWQRAVDGLLFYHPAAWWVSRVIRAERENCCDDAVVAASGDVEAYAEALAALEQFRSSGREPAVAATGGSLVKRIRRLLYPQVPDSAWTPLASAFILIATAAAALAAWQPEPLEPPQPLSSSTASPYEKWMTQDVAYIITDEERAAFQRLVTDEEREKFIEQFWLRRDPTPGTPANEFKEEHYRRIANSNERFRTASRAGWQTDRGRIYIVYGPPDELERHPRDAQRAYPWEIWLYRHVDGIGDNVTITFIDRQATGDYQLAPGNGR